MKRFILIIIIIILTSQFTVLAEEQNIDKNESYSWFSEDISPSYNISYEKSKFLINKESEGWEIKTYAEDDIFYVQNYLKEFQKLYPEEIINKYIDDIILIKSININDDYYAGTINDREIYTAVEITPNSEQIWIKMVLTHEFYHIREKFYSGNINDSPYKDFDTLVEAMNLNFYKDNGYSFHDWSSLENKKYGKKLFEKGFIREYSLFSKREFMANIAQAVDGGAYKILTNESKEIKQLMDAYIAGNIRIFEEMGYFLDEKFYTEFLPDYVENTYPVTYNKLRGLYSYKAPTVKDYILKYNYLLAILIIILLINRPINRKYREILESNEEKIRRKNWEEVLYGTKTLKEG